MRGKLLLGQFKERFKLQVIKYSGFRSERRIKKAKNAFVNSDKKLPLCWEQGSVYFEVFISLGAAAKGNRPNSQN